jgi:hypothetical protein
MAEEDARPSDGFTTKSFWNTVVTLAKGRGWPTFLLEWNQRNGTKVEESDWQRYRTFWETIELTPDVLDRCFSMKPTDKTSALNIGEVYNEAFHAWFDQEGKKSDWLMEIMKRQTQYVAGKRIEMAEEAMSELINYLSDKPYWEYPTYEDAMKTIRSSMVPGHNYKKSEGGETPISKELYYATLWIMRNGGVDPRSGDKKISVGKALEEWHRGLACDG